MYRRRERGCVCTSILSTQTANSAQPLPEPRTYDTYKRAEPLPWAHLHSISIWNDQANSASFATKNPRKSIRAFCCRAFFSSHTFLVYIELTSLWNTVMCKCFSTPEWIICFVECTWVYQDTLIHNCYLLAELTLWGPRPFRQLATDLHF